MSTKILDKLIGLEILNGAYLETAQSMLDEQKNFCDNDLCKNFNFYACSYWITFNNDLLPEGFDDDEDFLNFLSETKNLKNFIKFYFQK